VDLDAHLVVFNLAAIPAALRPVAAQLVGQFVWRQIRRRPDRRRLVYLDEGWTFLANPAGAAFLERASRQFRKYGAGLVVATQELADFLGHPAGRVVLAQAETKLLLAQSATTADQLAEVLKLTAPQRQFLLRAAPGQALLIAGTRCLPLTIEANADELAIGETRPERKAAATAYLRQRFADLPPATKASSVPGAPPPPDMKVATVPKDASPATPGQPTSSESAAPRSPEVVGSNGSGRWDWRARR
jgi:hypothetical protein